MVVSLLPGPWPELPSLPNLWPRPAAAARAVAGFRGAQTACLRRVCAAENERQPSRFRSKLLRNRLAREAGRSAPYNKPMEPTSLALAVRHVPVES